MSGADREAASVLIRALRAAESAWEAGETDGGALRSAMWRVLGAEPLADVDYVSVADPDTLAELDDVDPVRGALASMAGDIGEPPPMASFKLSINLAGGVFFKR